MPEISIIVPVYKTERYLPKCIESIIAQTFTDFELIIVDDGSPDESGIICDKYSEKDLRIKVIHQPNSGVSVARNAALDMATGKYIMFCDSDDWVEPDWCQCLYEAIQNPNVVMAVCGYKQWEQDLFTGVWKFTETDSAVMLSEIFEKPISGAPWNKIFLREQIEKYKLRFPEGISYGEDTLFIFNYLSNFKGDNCVFLSSLSQYNYRSLDSSLSHKYIVNYWELQKEVLALRLEVARIHNTDFEKNQEKVNYHYFKLVFSSINNIFHSKNDLPYLQKYKKLKEIVTSEEFEKMKKSEAYGNPPLWYRLLTKKYMLPLQYLYYSHKKYDL